MEHNKIEKQYMDAASEMLANKEMVDSVSVAPFMKNGAELYDVQDAVQPFEEFLEWMYA